jgi:acyl carrier protein
MQPYERVILFDFVVALLCARDDSAPLADNESLFVSGRLDSLSAVELVEFLEQELGVDFAKIDFEIALIDSIDAVADLVQELRA